jgi:hypothetical protein
MAVAAPPLALTHFQEKHASASVNREGRSFHRGQGLQASRAGALVSRGSPIKPSVSFHSWARWQWGQSRRTMTGWTLRSIMKSISMPVVTVRSVCGQENSKGFMTGLSEIVPWKYLAGNTKVGLGFGAALRMGNGRSKEKSSNQVKSTGSAQQHAVHEP